jgi:hypothetical protein
VKSRDMLTFYVNVVLYAMALQWICTGWSRRPLHYWPKTEGIRYLPEGFS